MFILQVNKMKVLQTSIIESSGGKSAFLLFSLYKSGYSLQNEMLPHSLNSGENFLIKSQFAFSKTTPHSKEERIHGKTETVASRTPYFLNKGPIRNSTIGKLESKGALG